MKTSVRLPCGGRRCIIDIPHLIRTVAALQPQSVRPALLDPQQRLSADPANSNGGHHVSPNLVWLHFVPAFDLRPRARTTFELRQEILRTGKQETQPG